MFGNYVDTFNIFTDRSIFTLIFLHLVLMKIKIPSISNMCSDVTEHFHRNHLNNLSHKLFKGTLQCCGGNDTNTVRQLYFV